MWKFLSPLKYLKVRLTAFEPFQYKWKLKLSLKFHVQKYFHLYMYLMFCNKHDKNCTNFLIETCMKSNESTDKITNKEPDRL